MRTGVVRRTGGGVYRVALDDGEEVEASLRGRLKREARAGGRVVVGDRVHLAPAEGDHWTIESVEERRSAIVRRSGPGRKPKVVAANVDVLVVVVAGAEPPPDLEGIDRLLVLAESDGVDARIVVNKIDLAGAAPAADRIRSIYEPVGYPVLRTSAFSAAGLDRLAEWLCEGTSAFVGPSGVGKSSLLNALEPGLLLRTGALSGRGGRGRHTTVQSRLVPLTCGGAVADTPGFAEVGLWGIQEEELERCFPEIHRRAAECRFRGCRHRSEPGCALRDAVATGEVAAERLASFHRLLEEAREEPRRRS